MNFSTDYRLENFILNTRWEDVPSEVKERVRGCLLDLLGALTVGSRSAQFDAGLRLAKKAFKKGDVAVVGTDEKFDFLGASAVMGHSSNAYDIDDGHNLTRAHPGTSFIGAVLAAAYEKDILLTDLYAAMPVAYETTIRSGAAIMEFYNFPHSSGTFGAVGIGAGVGRIYGFTKEQMNNVLSVAEFNAPLVPGARSVEYPSMNKDGVPFGVMVGALSVLETLAGFTGNKNLLESDEHKHFLDGLGESYEIMNLYFKPYPCCRWAHPAIDAIKYLMSENKITSDNVERVEIETFERATMLSKIVPKTSDEAQYNIAYPVAATIVHGDFGMKEVSEEGLSDPKVIEMMGKLVFSCDDSLTKQFPAKRICRAIMTLKDGRVLRSPDFEPTGEAKDGVDFEWLKDKFYRITAPVIDKSCQDYIVNALRDEKPIRVRTLIDELNKKEHWKL